MICACLGAPWRISWFSDGLIQWRARSFHRTGHARVTRERNDRGFADTWIAKFNFLVGDSRWPESPSFRGWVRAGVQASDLHSVGSARARVSW